jgi:hypothetical protein
MTRRLFIGDPKGPEDWDFVYEAFRRIKEASFKDDGTLFYEVEDAASGRDALELGGSSTLDVGTTAGTVAAGDDSRIVNAVQTSRTLTAGAGLTGGGSLAADRSFAVGAGTGITVNADDVALTTPVSVANGGTNAATAADARSNLGLAYGKQTIVIPAGAMTHMPTNGPARSTVAFDDEVYDVLLFDPSTQEGACFCVPFPKSWDRGVINFQPYWSHPATTTQFRRRLVSAGGGDQ